MARVIWRMTSDTVPTFRRLLLGLGIFHVIAPVQAWAYLDPITGSIVLQVLAAGFLAAAATFRRSREAISRFLRKFTRAN